MNNRYGRMMETAGCFCLAVMVVFVLCLSTREGNEKARKRSANEFIGNYQGQDTGNDPWGNPYQVVKEGDESFLRVRIRSAGKDGEFGTADDIRGGYQKGVKVEIIER